MQTKFHGDTFISWGYFLEQTSQIASRQNLADDTRFVLLRSASHRVPDIGSIADVHYILRRVVAACTTPQGLTDTKADRGGDFSRMAKNIDAFSTSLAVSISWGWRESNDIIFQLESWRATRALDKRTLCY
jgi:hypothetical protein